MKKFNSLLTIFKKELTRFFTDKRLAFTTILMPGLLIFVVYTLIGSGISSMMTAQPTKIDVVAFNAPQSVVELFDASGLPLSPADCSEDEATEQLKSGETHAVIIFPDGFEQSISTYEPGSGLPAPNVEIYYDSSNSDSAAAYSALLSILSAYESALANKFDVNAGAGNYDVAGPEQMTVQILQMMMPMLLILFLFAGCLSVAPESIAGEKERGTMASLLVTPVKRQNIALGKILALGLISFLSGLCSATGTLLSLPNMLDGLELDAAVYGFGEYAMTFAVIISTAFLLVSFVAIISSLSKSVKEATAMVSPLMLLVMLLSVVSAFGVFGDSLAAYFIPVVSSAQCISDIFSLNINAIGLVITIVTNLVYSALCAAILTKIFDSEKIIFNK